MHFDFQRRLRRAAAPAHRAIHKRLEFLQPIEDSLDLHPGLDYGIWFLNNSIFLEPSSGCSPSLAAYTVAMLRLRSNKAPCFASRQITQPETIPANSLDMARMHSKATARARSSRASDCAESDGATHRIRKN